MRAASLFSIRPAGTPVRSWCSGAACAAVLLACCCSCAGLSALWEEKPWKPYERNGIVHVCQPDDLAVVLGGCKGLAAVCFTDKYCRSCKLYAPAFKKTAAALAGHNDVCFILFDTYFNAACAVSYGVEGIPTTVFLKSGKTLEKIVGPIKEEALVNRIKALAQEQR